MTLPLNNNPDARSCALDTTEVHPDVRARFQSSLFNKTDRLSGLLIAIQAVLLLVTLAYFYPRLITTAFAQAQPMAFLVISIFVVVALLVSPAAIIRRRLSAERDALLTALQAESSARQTLQLSLVESESRFYEITDNISQVVWIQSAVTGEMLYVSPAYEHTYGRSCQTLYDKPRAFLELVHPDDLSRVLLVLEERLHATAEMEYRVCRDDGSVRWVHSRSFPVKNADDQIHRIVGTVEDITDRKRAELASQESEERYRELFENAKDAIYIHTLDEKYVSVNRAAEQMSGYSREEILGKTFSDFLPPERSEEIRAYTRRKLTEHGETTYETELIRKDGHRLSVEVSTRLILENGVPVGVQGMARDITERKLAETALRESEARHRQLFESNPQTMWVVDNGSGRFLAVNPAAVTHYGYTYEEFLVLTITDIWPEFGSVDHPSLSTNRHLRTMPVYSHLRKDGESIDAEVVSHPLQFGEYDAVLMMVNDVTERRRAENERRVRDQALEAARIKSEFLANMSHEIRTPMNGILGMTELALQTELSAQQREYMRIVKDSTLSLLTIVNDILDFSKIEAGKLALEAIPFSLQETVADAARTLALQAHEKGLELAWQISSAAPDALVGDPVRLRQVLTNLIGNAVKFTSQGEVVVSIKRTTNVVDDNVALLFSVSDTGIGIPAEKLPLVFQPFSQADGSITRQYGGTGLGLAICTQLVSLMGGDLTVESQEGQGSVFGFTASFGINSEAVAARPDGRGLQDLRVLVVDDNGTNRQILKDVLTHWNMKPTLVTGGQAALDAVRQAGRDKDPFALVLLDACMPGMDGFEVAERLKEIEETTGTTIMMLTSIEQNVSTARLREIGVNHYLVKPVSQSDLFNAIQSSLNPTARPTAQQHVAGTCLLPREPPRTFLLAEDNLTNQKLVVWTLEQQGHSVVVANNGQEALEALANGHLFDAVLMDVQMPVLNGLETTKLIRLQEQNTGRHIPIIAMTALAMKGDRERCLDAGMDGYLSKPVQGQELFIQLHRIFDRSSVPRAESVLVAQTTPAPNGNGGPPFNRALFLRSLGGNEAFAGKLVQQFLTDSPDLVSKLREALVAGDCKGVHHFAHALKGSAAIFHADRVVQLALALENLGAQDKLENAHDVLEGLDTELSHLHQAFISDGFGVPSVRPCPSDPAQR